MKTLTLRFDDWPDDEIVVRIQPVPTADLLDIWEQLRKVRLNQESMRELAERFVPFVESWTFPEPTDADGLMARDFNLFYAIVGSWVSGVRDAPLPLLRAPSDGEPSEAPLAS